MNLREQYETLLRRGMPEHPRLHYDDGSEWNESRIGAQVKILVLANGPSANTSLFQALKHKPDRIFGVNKSLRMWRDCTDYVVTDPNNCRLFMNEARQAQSRGCRLWLTPQVEQLYGAKADCPFSYDEKNKDRYSREQIAHGRAVGIVALQLALSLNPSELYLCGFDGYPLNWRTKHELASGMLHAEIEQFGRAQWWQLHNETAQHVLDQVLKDRTDVKFTWFKPQILEPLKADNVQAMP